MTIKLLMCDLDNTVRLTKSGSTFPENATDWKINPAILVARKKYPNATVVGISNQKGILLGHTTRQDVIAGIVLTMGFFPMAYVLVCPDEGSNAFIVGQGDFGIYNRDLPAKEPGHYRKPSPGMLLWAMGSEGVVPESCLFIGDYYTDKYAAEAAGVTYQDISEF